MVGGGYFQRTIFTDVCVRTSPIGDQQWWPSVTICTVADNGDQWLYTKSITLNTRKDAALGLGVAWERES